MISDSNFYSNDSLPKLLPGPMKRKDLHYTNTGRKLQFHCFMILPCLMSCRNESDSNQTKQTQIPANK